jgi:hypothetical protein
MGQERHRRVWPNGADHTVTVKATGEQLIRWHDAARNHSMTPHLGAFLARAADFYVARLEARLEMARRLDKDGKL